MKEKLKKMLCFKNIVLWLAGIVAIVAFIIALFSKANVGINYSDQEQYMRAECEYAPVVLTLGQFLKNGTSTFTGTAKVFMNGNLWMSEESSVTIAYTSTSIANEIIIMGVLGLVGGLGLAASTFIPDKLKVLRVFARLISIFLVIAAAVETLEVFSKSTVVDYKDGIKQYLMSGNNPMTLEEATKELNHYHVYFNNTCSAGVPFIIVVALGGMGLVVKTPEQAARKAEKKAEKAQKKAAKYNK